MHRIELALGRTALALGLRSLHLPANSVMLAPDFLCDVVWPAAAAANLGIVTYPIDDAFAPDWDAARVAVHETRVAAFLIVHYFGQPQDLGAARRFCDEHGLALIEDNAHGHGGALHGRLLGTSGDIGFSSPRKFLPGIAGGILYSKTPVDAGSIRSLPPYPVRRWKRRALRQLNRFPKVKARIRGALDLRKDWSNPRLYREGVVAEYAIDESSRRAIESADWPAMAAQRRASWTVWSGFAEAAGLTPALGACHPESCPWALPVYAAGIGERNKWLRWGARHGVSLFPWPALPEEILANGGRAFKRWERLVCFSLDALPA